MGNNRLELLIITRRNGDQQLKVDLCLWARNGAKTLPLVLKRIEEVMPAESIAQRIFVDDHSTDDTVKIAKDFNWSVYENKLGFVSGGTNEALRHVKTDFFVSVEQDLFLAREWWDKIPKHLENPKVVVAQGIRLPTHPALRVISSFDGTNFRCFSIDNNVYRTSVLRALGGFPKREPISVDRVLFHKIISSGYRWVIDTSVISAHIKLSVQDSYSLQRLLISKNRQLIDDANLLKVIQIFLTSPLRALQMSIKMSELSVVWAYPLIRLLFIKNFIKRKKLLKVLKLEPKEFSELVNEAQEQSCFPNPV